MRILSAIQIIQDWLGSDGKPVNQELSNHRALICSACPCNVKEMAGHVKYAVAKCIHQHLELKNKMKIGTHMDNDLKFCDKCGCVLSLKVHVPIEHIRAHTTDKQLDVLPAHCWQRKELNHA